MSRLKVDMGNIFEAGQAYVALSRATSLNGLQVLNFKKRSIQAHERVAEFYDKLNTVSELIEIEAAKESAKGKRTSNSKRTKSKAL
jgi:ATP-dependent DNA helicase PIF1